MKNREINERIVENCYRNIFAFPEVKGKVVTYFTSCLDIKFKCGQHTVWEYKRRK